MERSQYADAEWSCSRSDPGADLVRPAGIGPTVGESDGAELCAALCAASRAVYMADIPGGQVWRCRGSIQEAVVRIDLVLPRLLDWVEDRGEDRFRRPQRWSGRLGVLLLARRGVEPRSFWRFAWPMERCPARLVGVGITSVGVSAMNISCATISRSDSWA